MPTIAFLADEETICLTPDDQLAAAALRAEGFDVRTEQWDAPSARLENYDLCILRSCWDYHLRFREFQQWLHRIEEDDVNLLNGPKIVGWNSDKRYLKDLEHRGIPIIPTVVVDENTAQLSAIMESSGWNDAVIKPCISASSHRTHRVSEGSAHSYQEVFEEIVRETGALVQPFMREVQEEGEWSFIFFNKEFSHAVLKKPPDGEYRSQESFGGAVKRAFPSATQLRSAATVIETIDDHLLYARVDMIQVNGRLLLGELELIEPSLFFSHDPDSPARLTHAAARSLKREPSNDHLLDERIP